MMMTMMLMINRGPHSASCSSCSVDVLLGMYMTVTVWGAYHRIATDLMMGCQFYCVWLIDTVFIYPVISFMESGDALYPGLTPMHSGSQEEASTMKAIYDECAQLAEENKKLERENEILIKKKR